MLCRGNRQRDLWFQYNRRIAARLQGAKDRGAGTGVKARAGLELTGGVREQWSSPSFVWVGILGRGSLPSRVGQQGPLKV